MRLRRAEAVALLATWSQRRVDDRSVWARIDLCKLWTKDTWVDGVVTHNKLLAEWFWTDRWVGSSAFMLPIEARGLYREMLSAAWRRGAKLPNDHDAIKRAVGATDEEWARCWPQIEKYFRVKRGSLVNDTQVEIYRNTMAIQSARSRAGRRGGQVTQQLRRLSRIQAKLEANAKASAESKINPPSPSPVHKNPPTPLAGGRITKRELKHAAEIRKQAYGRCPHEPRCENYHACLVALAMEIRQKAKAS